MKHFYVSVTLLNNLKINGFRFNPLNDASNLVLCLCFPDDEIKDVLVK